MTQYLSQFSLARLLAAALLQGIALGMLYDVFRIRRIAFLGRGSTSESKRVRKLTSLLLKLLYHTEDLLFGTVAGIATAILYFALSRGQVRIMAIFGEGVGFLLYRLTLGRPVIACADSIIRLIALIIRLIVHFIIRPPCRLIGKVMKATATQLDRGWMRLRERWISHIGRVETERYCKVLADMASNGFESVIKKKIKHKD